MSHRSFPRRGLYLITPDSDDSASLLARTAEVLPHAVALQYRNKRAVDDTRRLYEARALRELCSRHGVCFVVNDDARLALEADADGVHLGRDDGQLAAARGLLGMQRSIGASCYDSLQRANEAVAAGADYIAFGALFPSNTKPDAARATPQLFSQAAGLGVPKVAIGGISPDNARQAVAAGADLIAVIGAVFNAADPAAAARACAAAFH